MCAGAIVNARIPTVVFGARDLRVGAFGSLLALCQIPLNHRPTVIPDVLGDEAREMLGAYFRKKRARQKGKRDTLAKAQLSSESFAPVAEAESAEDIADRTTNAAT